MDIFDFALKMEKDGEQFYRDIAAHTKSKGLKTILVMLADEEVKHYHAIEGMKQGRYHVPDSTVLENAKTVFAQMKDENEPFEPGQEQLDLYEKAKEIEKQSQQFYQEKAEQADNVEETKLFNRLAKEEKKHYYLLENLIELVSRPKQWLEDAEWYHLDEY